MAAASPTEVPSRRAPFWAEAVATFFGAGYGKPGPGTWGSAGAVLTWLLIASRLPQQWHTAGAAIYALAATLIGIPAATQVARAMGREDPQKVVIDEVAGQMIALIAVPLHWKPVLAAFILFRAFDMTKPWPIRKLESLPEGWGIMADDLGAGLLAFVIMQALLHFHVIA